ncbi:hypothetical protein [Thiothrix subterranea]|uniref:Lipoprotein n=1 Tax=Thiothrix subterranea TaxID=2735563 RepID=A0AA51R0A4_9GAMM|nr:hypothetical protein [Thiothrix subterranea]WML85479.1 hypothetical protein RCG00_14365 [Thiothrix subterranea]
MSAMRFGGIAVLTGSVLLSACVPNGVYVDPFNPWGVPTYPPATPVPVTYVDVYKYQGSRQCEGGGTPLAEMQRQLQAGGAIVTSTSCGMDGRMYPAFCGGADGKINIFTISSNSMNAALAQGFTLLTNLPEAQKTSCYNAPASTGTSTSTSTTYPYTGSNNSSYYSYQ